MAIENRHTRLHLRIQSFTSLDVLEVWQIDFHNIHNGGFGDIL